MSKIYYTIKLTTSEEITCEGIFSEERGYLIKEPIIFKNSPYLAADNTVAYEFTPYNWMPYAAVREFFIPHSRIVVAAELNEKIRDIYMRLIENQTAVMSQLDEMEVNEDTFTFNIDGPSGIQ